MFQAASGPGRRNKQESELYSANEIKKDKFWDSIFELVEVRSGS